MVFTRCSRLVLQLCCLGALVSAMLQNHDTLTVPTAVGTLEISPQGVKFNKSNSSISVVIPASTEPAYYVQRDGNVMMTRGSGGISLSAPVPGGQAQDKIIETNALLQNMPAGVRLGEIRPGMTDAQYQNVYPHNPVVSESPKIFNSPRPELSVDQIIKSNSRTPHQLHYASDTGDILMELDMRLTYAQYMHYYENRRIVPREHNGRGRRVKRKALRSQFTYWPNGVIPFTVDGSFSQAERRLLDASLQAWMEDTCVQFIRARPTDKDVLHIQNGKGCNSFVGRIGGQQNLNLEAGCRVKHVMTHELGHVIGLIHEHQRPDRDDYIIVATENVGVGRMKNYRKFDSSRINLFGVDYDYNSIMHYGRTAFSKDDVSTTMITRNPSFQDIIGTSSKVSFKDAKVVNSMYKCDSNCRRKPSCGEGYVNRYCRCVCPGGTQRCAQRRWRTVTSVPQSTRPNPRIRMSGFSNRPWRGSFMMPYEPRPYPPINPGFGQYYPSAPYVNSHYDPYYPPFK
ncbi:blastula protease 10-like [Haliotis cracherodii]|uniref:blastula protease 10-like n=1 Tax=Haliotis cracherodii TaxID=6455 RepID=UPI0039E76B55